MKSLLTKMIDLLLPRYCPMCGNRLLGDEETLCIDCLLGLPRTDAWADLYENEMAKLFWHQIPIERCAALFFYQRHAPASNIVYKLKYGNRPDLARDMGRLLAQEALLADFFKDVEAIVPVPLSKSRQRQRGYNQSLEIAHGLSKETGIPVIADAVGRKSFTESQTHKNRWQRRDNVDGVFSLANPSALDGLTHIVVVDDVCTTGATIIACCHPLMQQYPQLRISVLTLAYAKT